MLNLNNMTEQEIYFALTGVEDMGFKPKIIPAEGNKVGFDEVLEFYKGANFDEFFTLLSEHKDSDVESVKKYNTYIFEHPMHELLGKFIKAGFLDSQFNYKDNYLY